MKAIYPGSFDPVTAGHLDIVERAERVFDEVIVAVGANMEKRPFFSVEERVDLLRKSCGHMRNVTVDCFEGLLVDYVERKNSNVVIRSLRAVSDFEYEFQMALMNKRLNDRIETVFMMTNPEHLFLSSSLVKEVAELGASLDGLVPAEVAKLLQERIQMKGQEAQKHEPRAGDCP